MDSKEISETLRRGEVVMIPTDTVMGLICDYYNKDAEREIFRLKKRPEDKILSIFVGSIDEIKKITAVSERQKKFMSQIWPGKVTCIVNKNIGGFRIPDNKLILDILREFGGPLLQTSANISGEEPIGGGVPSTVVDLTEDSPRILREGAISTDKIFEIWRRTGK